MCAQISRGEKQHERTENLTWESLILNYGSSSMTFTRNWNFLSFPILDSYLIAKQLLGYDIFVENLATEIQELVKAHVEIIIYLVCDVAHNLLLALHKEFEIVLFLETLFKWQKTYFRLLYIWTCIIKEIL